MYQVLLQELSFLPVDEPRTKIEEVPAEIYNAGTDAVLLWRRQNHKGWTVIDSREVQEVI